MSDSSNAAGATASAVKIFVCCYRGTEELMKDIWEKCLPGESIFYQVVEPDYSLIEAITDAVCNDGIDESFIFIPANVIPCSQISFEDLTIPLVYIKQNGAKEYAFRMPMQFDKEKLIPVLASEEQLTNVKLCSEYAKLRNRAVEISFNFGNFICPVLRGNPCEHVVIEGLVRRKFLCASFDGWSAIAKILKLSFKISEK